jgi:IS5 family transposase
VTGPEEARGDEARSFASLSFESKKKLTRRERVLEQINHVVPWADLLALLK